MSKDHTTSSGLRPSPSLAASLEERFGEDEGASGSSDKATAFLVGLSGKHAGKLFRIREGTHVIGRTSRGLIQLDEKAVSHQHASLSLDISACVISDMGSTNGTFVNDEKLEAPRELRAGDVIRVGMTSLGFLTDAEDDGQHTRALARVTRPNLIPNTAQALALPSQGSVAPQVSAQLVGVPTGMSLAGGPPTNPIDKILDLIELSIRFVRANWGFILGFAVAFALLGAWTIRVAPPMSTAAFEIFLRTDQTKTAAQYYASREVEYFFAAEKNFVNEDLVRKTLEDVGRSAGPGLVRSTSLGLSFQKQGPGIYRGEYSARTQKEAEDFLAQHLTNYLEWEIGKALTVQKSELELLRKQFKETTEQLDEQESALKDFKEGNIENLPGASNSQMETRTSLLMQRDRLSADLVRYSEKLALVRKQLASEDAFLASRVAKSGTYDSAIQEVRRRIAEAQASGLAEGHPDILKLKGEEQNLVRLRDQEVNAETTDTDRRANAEHRRLQNEAGELSVGISSASKELAQVEGRLAEIEKLAGKMPAVEAEMSERFRELEGTRQLHGRLFSQLKSKELEYQFERANVAARYEVLKPPEAFPLDYQASTIKRAVFGAVGGALVGVVVGILNWLFQYARNRKRTT